MTEEPLSPSSDERFIVAISHFFGLLVALIAWFSHKDKSLFVRFQLIQAMVFDLLEKAIIVLVFGCTAGLVFSVLALGIGDIALIGSQNNPTAEPIKNLIALMTATPFLIPCIIIPFMAIFFIARVIATIQTFQGIDFHYPWLGSLLERSLADEKNAW